MHKCQMSPIIYAKVPHYMAKETSLYLDTRGMRKCQKRRMHMAKEAY